MTVVAMVRQGSGLLFMHAVSFDCKIAARAGGHSFALAIWTSQFGRLYRV